VDFWDAPEQFESVKLLWRLSALVITSATLVVTWRFLVNSRTKEAPDALSNGAIAVFFVGHAALWLGTLLLVWMEKGQAMVNFSSSLAAIGGLVALLIAVYMLRKPGLS
jgi:hypothetical protein